MTDAVLDGVARAGRAPDQSSPPARRSVGGWLWARAARFAGPPSWRFNVALVLLAVLPAAAVTVVGVLNAMSASQAAENRRLADTVHALRLAVDSVLQEYIDAGRLLVAALDEHPADIDGLARRARVIDKVLAMPVLLIGPPPDLTILFHSRLGLAPAVHRTPDTLAIVRPRLLEAFRTGEPQFVDLFTGGFGEGRVLSLQVPVVRDGKAEQVIALVIDPARISAVLAAQRPNEVGAFASMVDGNGRIAANSRAPEQFIGLRVPRWFTAAVAESMPRGLAGGVSMNGEDVVVGYERSAIAPRWLVNVSESRAAYRAAIWRPVRPLGFAVPVVLTVAGAGVLVMWNGRRAARLDATAQRAARRTVMRSLDRLPALIYRSHVAPGGQYRQTFVAGDFEAVVGWPESYIDVPANWQAHQEPGTPTTAEILQQVGREGHSAVEYRFAQPDGSWRWLRIRAQLDERLPTGTFIVSAYVVNITAEREATAKLVASGRLASLGELAGGLAHELRQPLAAISMAAENADLALEQGDTVAARRKYERIIQQTQRAGELIEHLRRFARGGDAEPMRAVSLVDVMASVMEIAGTALRHGSVALDMWLGQPPPVVICQPVPLEQVILNLLINARDATAALPPGMPRRVLIGARRDGANAVLTIADNGGGIAPRVMSRLFEPFVTTKAANKGTGLGLAICHGLMQGMNGSIAAHNDADGAVFTLTLPLA